MTLVDTRDERGRAESLHKRARPAARRGRPTPTPPPTSPWPAIAQSIFYIYTISEAARASRPPFSHARTMVVVDGGWGEIHFYRPPRVSSLIRRGVRGVARVILIGRPLFVGRLSLSGDGVGGMWQRVRTPRRHG